jgi:flagellar motor switch protein FliM
VIQRLVEVICEEYKKAWQGIYPLELEYQRSEMQPQFANIATPSEIVVATSFTLEIGETTGTVHFCIPYSTLEPIRDVLYSVHPGRRPSPTAAGSTCCKQQIQSAEVDLVAELAHARPRWSSCWPSSRATSSSWTCSPMIQAKVDGVPVFDCHYGTSQRPLRDQDRQLLDQLQPDAGSGADHE